MERTRRSRVPAGLGIATLVAVVAFLALASGGSGNARDARDAKVARATQSATTTTSPGAESFQVFATRDPFEPVISPGTTPGTTPTTTPGTTTPGGTGTTSPTTSPSFEPPAGQAVSLLDVFEETDSTPRARVQVGSTVYTVGEGQTFATSYQVVSLDADAGCGVFLFGDSQFELCEGEQVIK